MKKENYIKLIFGLKVKQLRTDQKLSLSELASKTGMSVSYLNEIETGKKYPKTDKIAAISGALGTTYDKLISLKLSKNLTSIGEFLESNILEQLPLDHYGIDINKLILLMSDSSMQLSALIAAFIETAQTSELSQNNFSKTALRTFKEFNENYFDEIENAAEKFIKKYKLKPVSRISFSNLKSILDKYFDYKIDEGTLNNIHELSGLRAVVIKSNKNILLINNKLSDAQKAYIAGKELAYNFLGIKDRSFVHSSLRLKTFDHLLNNFKASYFSTAILINRKLFIKDLEQFFNSKKWNEKHFLKLTDKYNCTTEMFFQRMTNLSPKFFGLNKIFFIRFNHEIGSEDYKLSNELRLNTRRNPGANPADEHFCRRWISFKTLNDFEVLTKKKKNFSGRISNICHSKFYDSKDEYICISAGQRGNLFENTISSITIGFQVDESLKNKFKFLYDPAIPNIIVNDACERCEISNCKERISPPITSEKINNYKKLEDALQQLKEKFNA